MSTYLDSADSDDDLTSKLSSCVIGEAEISTIKESCIRLKAEGNEFFAQSSFDDAIEKYSEAIKLLKDANLPKDPIILLNRCASYLSVKKFVPALNDANQGTEVLIFILVHICLRS